MQITDVKVRKLFDEGPMKAIVSVTFDAQLAVHDIKVINAREKFFIVMPSRKNPDDTYRDIVHPINAEFRGALESAVIDAYHVQLIAMQNELAMQEEEAEAQAEAIPSAQKEEAAPEAEAEAETVESVEILPAEEETASSELEQITEEIIEEEISHEI